MGPRPVIPASIASSRTADSRPPAPGKRRVRRKRGCVPLLQRMTALNVVLLVAATAVTIAVLEPRKLTSFAVDEEEAVLLAAALVGLANVSLLRRLIGPIHGLTALARVAQEAPTNAARHSGSGRAEPTLSRRGDVLTPSIWDEGRGRSPRCEAGPGMREMRERASLLGATLQIRDRVSTKGCEVRLDVPLEERA
jgi:anti-sigma regulatory factor (Ser/Thr protein kinase)